MGDGGSTHHADDIYAIGTLRWNTEDWTRRHGKLHGSSREAWQCSRCCLVDASLGCSECLDPWPCKPWSDERRRVDRESLSKGRRSPTIVYPERQGAAPEEAA